MKMKWFKSLMVFGLLAALLSGFQASAAFGNEDDDETTYASSKRQEAIFIPYTWGLMEEMDTPFAAVLHGRASKDDYAVVAKGVICTPFCFIADVVCLPWDLCKLLWTSRPTAWTPGKD